MSHNDKSFESSSSHFDEFIDRNKTHSIKIEVPKRLYKKEDLISLGCADFEIAVPPQIQQAIQQRAIHPVYGYTEYYDGLYNAINSYYKRHHKIDIQKDDIYFTPGVVPGIALMLQALITDADKAICLLVPEYPPFQKIIDENGFKTHHVMLKKNEDDAYYVDMDELQETLKKCSVLLYSNPHNPTTNVFTKEQQIQIKLMCDENDITILADEIWADLVYKPNRHYSMLRFRENKTMIFFAGSKSYNIAGLHISICVTKDQNLKQLLQKQLQKLHFSTSNVFGITALETAFTECDQWLWEFLEYLRKNAEFCVEEFKYKMPLIQATMPMSTTLLWLDFSKMFKTTKEAEQFCVNAGVYLQPGTDFCENVGVMLRLNFGSSKQIIEKALKRIKNAYDSFCSQNKIEE